MMLGAYGDVPCAANLPLIQILILALALGSVKRHPIERARAMRPGRKQIRTVQNVGLAHVR